MFERFTGRARRGVVLAQEECRHRGHREVDVSHLALGALTVSEGAGLSGSDVDAVRDGVESTLAGRAVDPGASRDIVFSPAAKIALERSLQLSLRDRRSYIDSRDVLLAAIEQPMLTEPIMATGIDLSSVRTAITAGRAAGGE